MKKGKVLGFVIHMFAVLITLAFVLVAIFANKYYLMWVALGALVHYVCSSIIHELGHLIVIKKRKCKIVGWNILGFYNDKTNDTCGYSVTNYAGSISFVSSQPENAKEDLQKVSLGGVFANVIYLVACLVIGFAIWDKISTLILLCGSYVSVYMVLINILPLREDGDGSVYFGVKNGNSNYLCMINLAKILSYLDNGYSPKEIPQELYEVTDGYMAEGVKYYKMLNYIQLGELRKAYELALELQEENEGVISPERLYIAIRLNYVSEINPLSDSIAYLEQESAKYFRINGAYRKYCKDEEWTAICKQSGLKAVKGEYFKGLGKFEEELINLL